MGKKNPPGRSLTKESPPPYGEDFSHPRFLPALIVLALAIRLLFLWQSRNDYFTQHLVIDARFYDQWAVRILKGDWIGTKVYYQDPLYAYFLAFCYGIFGHSSAAIRIAQAALDSATVWIFFAIGRSAFTKKVGMIAATIAAIYGPLVYYTGLLDKTTLTIFLTALSLLSFLRAQARPTLKRFALSGFSFGVTALIRGNILLVAGALSVLLLGSKLSDSASPRWKRSASFVFGVLLVVAPITARNYLLTGDFILLTSNAGVNFFIGNNPYTAGNYIEPPFLRGIPETEYDDARRVAEETTGRPLSPASVSRFWVQQSMRFILNSPLQWIELIGRKLFMTLNWFEIPETFSFDYYRSQYSALWLAPITFSLLVLLSAFALTTPEAYANPPRPIVIFELVYVLSLLLFFITSRYRIPLIVPVIPLAAFGIDRLSREYASREFPTMAREMGMAAIVWICSAWTPTWLHTFVIQPGLSTPHTMLGTLLQGDGDIRGSISEFKKSLAIFPDNPRVYMLLAGAYASIEDISRAIDSTNQAIKLNPKYAEAYNDLAGLYFRQKKYRLAIESIRHAVDLNPNDIRFQNNLKALDRAIRDNR